MEYWHTIRCGNRAKDSGFTLVELIMALTVFAVAMSGFVALYGVSLELANEARQKTTAAELAQTHLAMLAASPDAFIWRIDPSDATTLFPINQGEDDPIAGNLVSPPDVLLVNRNTHACNEDIYRRFRCQAWGRLSSPDAQAYEITVAVYWHTRGKQRSLALTSSVPRYRAPDAAIVGGAATCPSSLSAMDDTRRIQEFVASGKFCNTDQ